MFYCDGLCSLEMFKSVKLVYHTTQELMEANDFFWKDSKLWFSQIMVIREEEKQLRRPPHN